MSIKRVKAIDIFSGGGGVSIGLVQAGFSVKCAVEIDCDAVKAYKNYHHLEDVNIINNDITNISGEEILRCGGISKNELYLLAGCPPCQKFSMQSRKLNKKTSEDEIKRLLMQYLRVIKELYPPFILMENVPGIRSSFNGKILDEFMTALKNEFADFNKQYYVISDVLCAADYGVPQLRKRFVLHAVRRDIHNLMQSQGFEFNMPIPTHSKNGENAKNKWVTVRETFEGLPPIEAGERYSDSKVKNHSCCGLSDLNKRRMEIIRQNGGSRSGLPPDLVLECHKKFSGHADVYGIMNPDMPSPTITGGCLCYSKGRFGHPFENRAISVREAARLQTFPDDYVFGENLGKAGLEIGNAVPVKLVKASGQTLLSYIYEYMTLYK